MKKIIALVFVSVVLFSCKKDNAVCKTVATPVKAKAVGALDPGQNIHLVGATCSYTPGKFGGAGVFNRYFEVEVANLGFAKTVLVHQEMTTDGGPTWTDYPLTYKRTTSTGTEVFAGTASLQVTAGTAYAFDDQFAIQYQVNGNTYWDNNNGTNYTMSGSNDVTNAVLGNGINILGNSSFFDTTKKATTFKVSVNVNTQDAAGSQLVQVVYTTDGWATQKTLTLSYAFAYYNSAYKNWTGKINIHSKSLKQIQYAISYTAAGTTYWDNNFGQNYTDSISKKTDFYYQ
jgi:hypothetical protein